MSKSLDFVRRYWGSRCAYCLERFNENKKGKKRTREHIIPKSRGGTKKEINMLFACEMCNHTRDNKHLRNVFPKHVRDHIARYLNAQLLCVLKSKAPNIHKVKIYSEYSRIREYIGSDVRVIDPFVLRRDFRQKMCG